MGRTIGSVVDDVTIRAAIAADIATMQTIEIAAGRAFLDVDMPEIAGAEPMSDERLLDYINGGRAWVAASATSDQVVGFIVADVVDGNAHIEQVSVHPDAAHRRLGARLIDVVGTWAAAGTIPALTLTTFADVPWNAPYYERLGFSRLVSDDLSEGLRALMTMEAAHGLDPAQRVAMSRPVSAAVSG
jgi:ribosomal protein S18 acetylase RimI-like enzyme